MAKKKMNWKKHYMVPSYPIADFHMHGNEVNEPCYTLDQWAVACQMFDFAYGVIVRHNFSHQETIRKYGLNPKAVFHKYKGMNFSLGTEVTCRSKTPSGVKLHLLVVAPDLSPESPIVKLMELKMRNDALVDHGLLHFVAKLYGMELNNKDILHFASKYAKGKNKIVTFGREKTYDFFMENGINPCASSRGLHNLLQHSPNVNRVNLSVEEVVKIANASRAKVIMAHPSASLYRLSNSEIEDVFREFFELGGRIVETNCSFNDPKVYNIMYRVANEMGVDVIESQSSDVHVPDTNVTVGKPKGQPFINANDLKGLIETISSLEGKSIYIDEETEKILCNVEAKVIAEEAKYSVVFDEQREYLADVAEETSTQQFDGSSIIADVVDPTIDDDMLL